MGAIARVLLYIIKKRIPSKNLHVNIVKVNSLGLLYSKYISNPYIDKKNIFARFVIKNIPVNQIFKHIVSIHKEGRAHHCQLCTYSSKYKQQLERHIESIHLRGEHPCDYCDYKATAKRNLSIHMKRMHVGTNEKHNCNICIYQTKFKSDLAKHKKVCRSGKVTWFKCDLCTHKTIHDSALKN